MADWIDVPDSNLLPGKPAKSADFIAMKDNVTALAEGAVGAPLIVAGALTSTERMNATNVGNNLTTAYVGSRTAGLAVGSVGSYALLLSTVYYGTGTTAKGTIRAGSELRFSDSNHFSGDVPSGSWRLMGQFGPNTKMSALWLRIS